MVTVILGKYMLKSNKTAGNHFDSNGKVHSFLWVVAFLQHAPKRSSAAKMEGFLQIPEEAPKSSAEKM